MFECKDRDEICTEFVSPDMISVKSIKKNIPRTEEIQIAPCLGSKLTVDDEMSFAILENHFNRHKHLINASKC